MLLLLISEACTHVPQTLLGITRALSSLHTPKLHAKNVQRVCARADVDDSDVTVASKISRVEEAGGVVA